jgi:GxxExxY protein
MKLECDKITEQIIKATFKIYNILGYGFLEKVYQKAMQVELIRRGLKADLEYPVKVYFKNVNVGEYSADIFVEEEILVELKVAKIYNKEDEPQLLNELKATRVKVGMLINFGKNKVEFKRFVY